MSKPQCWCLCQVDSVAVCVDISLYLILSLVRRRPNIRFLVAISLVVTACCDHVKHDELLICMGNVID